MTTMMTTPPAHPSAPHGLLRGPCGGTWGRLAGGTPRPCVASKPVWMAFGTRTRSGDSRLPPPLGGSPPLTVWSPARRISGGPRQWPWCALPSPLLPPRWKKQSLPWGQDPGAAGACWAACPQGPRHPGSLPPAGCPPGPPRRCKGGTGWSEVARRVRRARLPSLHPGLDVLSARCGHWTRSHPAAGTQHSRGAAGHRGDLLVWQRSGTGWQNGGMRWEPRGGVEMPPHGRKPGSVSVPSGCRPAWRQGVAWGAQWGLHCRLCFAFPSGSDPGLVRRRGLPAASALERHQPKNVQTRRWPGTRDLQGQAACVPGRPPARGPMAGLSRLLPCVVLLNSPGVWKAGRGQGPAWPCSHLSLSCETLAPTFFSSFWGPVSSRKLRSRPSSGTKSSTFWTFVGASVAGAGSEDSRNQCLPAQEEGGDPDLVYEHPTTRAAHHAEEPLPGLTLGRRGRLGSGRCPKQP